MQSGSHPRALTGGEDDGGKRAGVAVGHAAGPAISALPWEAAAAQEGCVTSRYPRRLPGTVVFDLDGTLVDTAADLTAALNHALGWLGRPPVPASEVRHMVGHGARKLLERGLAASGVTTPELVEAGVAPFLAFYADHIADGSRPWPGVEAALDSLAAAGCRLAICTNKPVALSRALVAALGWEARFGANLGFDSVPRPKPDAGHVLAAIAAVDGDRGDCVFVGDSITDVSAARAAAVPVVAVSFGFSDRPAAELGADRLIDHFDDLFVALAELATEARP